jgi:hypothetical protein
MIIKIRRKRRRRSLKRINNQIINTPNRSTQRASSNGTFLTIERILILATSRLPIRIQNLNGRMIITSILIKDDGDETAVVDATLNGDEVGVILAILFLSPNGGEVLAARAS